VTRWPGSLQRMVRWRHCFLPITDTIVCLESAVRFKTTPHCCGL
jgi:hypothetical protein